MTYTVSILRSILCFSCVVPVYSHARKYSKRSRRCYQNNNISGNIDSDPRADVIPLRSPPPATAHILPARGHLDLSVPCPQSTRNQQKCSVLPRSPFRRVSGLSGQMVSRRQLLGAGLSEMLFRLVTSQLLTRHDIRLVITRWR